MLEKKSTRRKPILSAAIILVLIPLIATLSATLSRPASAPGTGWTKLIGTMLKGGSENATPCPPDNFDNYDPVPGGYASRCQYVIESWSSAIPDPARNRLIIWGGGHDDYAGNEIYSLELGDNPPQLIRLDPPSPPNTQGGVCVETLSDHRPNSRHTYDSLIYFPTQDEMLSFGGALNDCGNPGDGTWLLKLSSVLSSCAPNCVSQWTQLNPTTVPDEEVGVTSGYDPNTGLGWLATQDELFSFDPTANQFTFRANISVGYHGTGIVDPDDEYYIHIDSNTGIHYWSIASGSAFKETAVTASGCSPLVNNSGYNGNSGYVGLAWDPISHAVIGYPNGGNVIYVLTPKTWTCTTETYGSTQGTDYPQNDPSTSGSGTFKHFNYLSSLDEFVLINDPNNDAWVLHRRAPQTNQAPSITSASNATFTLSQPGTFTVTTTGSPTPSLAESGAVPSGVILTDNGNGTATLAGTPASTGTFNITLTAANGVAPNAVQNFTLTVGQSPSITSANNTAFAMGQSNTFTVTATGSSSIQISESGALPTGVTFSNGVLSGIPLPGTAGIYSLIFTASNGLLPNATQNFTLSVLGSPTITSGNSAAFVVGFAGTFTLTSAGFPTAAWSEIGALPTGVTFTDNGNGTATLAGTPAPGTAGTYPLGITAANGVPPNATQTFTLTVNQAPAITTGNSSSFTISSTQSFTVVATGSPTPALTESGALPSGVTFTDNGNGTASLAGAPAAGTAGTYTLGITAANGVLPNATQNFTLTVVPSVAITSGNVTTFTVGQADTFTVTTAGSPTPPLSESGALPSGVTFTDNGNGTATLAGTPTAGTAGPYPLSITATNGVPPDAIQSFTLTVNQGPAITSTNVTTFSVGQAGTFSVTATGAPTPALTEMGALPSGVTFTDNGNGTATLAGIAATGTPGPYNFNITAANGVLPHATQSFTLTVTLGPAITSASSTTFGAGQPGTFTVTTTGSPTPSLTESGGLPSGVTFTDNGNGTGTLAGTTTATGIYNISLTAHNGADPDALQNFTLTVGQAPAITSAANTTFTLGQPATFAVTATGSPTPSLKETSSLPSGVTFTDNGNGTGTLAGTASTGGTFNVSFTASNGLTPNATQNFTLTVNLAPAITSANNTTFTAGQAGAFKVTATGFPAPTLSESGALPSGVTFKASTGTLSGTPGAATGGTYNITFTSSNGVLPNAVQNFTLTVNGGTSSLSFSPPSRNFGTLYAGATAKASTTVTNTGTTTVTFNSFTVGTISGDDSTGFTATRTCAKTLAAHSTCTITMSFTADSNVIQTHAANLLVTDTASGSPQTIPMSATVINPLASFNPTNLNFGTQKAKTTSAAKTITLTNTGTTTLTLSNIVIRSPFASGTSGTCTTTTSLAPNAACTIAVVFSPTKKGLQSANMTITDNAKNSPQTVSLSGTGN
jgi:hypothetical protein